MKERLTSESTRIENPKHVWHFRSQFRRGAFGWRSDTPIQRIREAISEIKLVERSNPSLAAEGGVCFLEKVSPALEQVDSSSGAIGNAVNNAIIQLVEIIIGAPGSDKQRDAWMERLFKARQEDCIPYLELLDEYWGALCKTKERASAWADRLLPATREALCPSGVGGWYRGTIPCLSSLYAAGRYDELFALVREDALWHCKIWTFKALVQMGDSAEAIRRANTCRGHYVSEETVDSFCEEVLLSAGLVDEAYTLYAPGANRKQTYLAWFRAVLKKYPLKQPVEVLNHLVQYTPGNEGKWFVAAKEAKLFDEALDLAKQTPCDPKALTRAARDFSARQPKFAYEAGLLALQRLLEGYCFEISYVDVYNAFDFTIAAARNADAVEDAYQRIRLMVENPIFAEGMVKKSIRAKLAPQRPFCKDGHI